MHLSVRYVGGLLALIDVYARLLAEVDEPEAAIRLWGSYDQAREQTGRALDQPQEAAVREAAVTSARTTVGEDAFRGAFAAGMSMSIEEAVMWARERDRGQTRPL